MIKTNIVFILGAGSNEPFGFPSGTGLLKIILENIDNSDWAYLLEYFGISKRQVREFKTALLRSNVPSVDTFLEHRPEFLKIGKLAISLALIPFEDEEKLFDIKMRGNNWYEYIFTKMDTNFDNWENNKVSFITFNYDRSLEHYFFESLKAKYGKSDEECAVKLNKIPIIHVHGQLGVLPWQEGESREYFHKPDEFMLKKTTEQIYIVSEVEDTNSEFKKAYDCMKDAKRIYFLGFGYNDTNLRRLKIQDFSTRGIIYGTAFKLGAMEAKSIRSKWPAIRNLVNQKILSFLKNAADFR